MLTRLLLPYMEHGIVDDSTSMTTTTNPLPPPPPAGRIVTVASTAHTFGQLNFANLNFDDDDDDDDNDDNDDNKNNNNQYNPNQNQNNNKKIEERKYTAWGAYGQSKLANILFAKALSDQLQSHHSQIVSVSLHPGVIGGTNLWRYTPISIPSWVQPFFNALIPDGKTIEQGAATNVYACLINEHYCSGSNSISGGDYLMDCQVVEPNQYGKDELQTLRKKLWVTTEKMIVENGYTLPPTLF